MNRKTVLFLMNGFGVESKYSYSIYNSNLMPTLDELTKKYLFSTINSDVCNYYDGYRNASLDINELYNYSIIDKFIDRKEFTTNENLSRLKQDLDTKKGNLHIFSFVDTSLKLVDHLKEELKFLNPDKIYKVYLHFIMTGNNINDYKKLIEVFTKINMEFNNVAPVGLITGLSSVGNNTTEVDLNFLFKMFISKVGEKWSSFTQKFDVLYGTKVLPLETKPFMINTNFELSKDDIFLFNNYDTIDLTTFINTLSNINFGTEKNNFSYYSLFKINSSINIPNFYESKLAENSLVKNLEALGSKCTVICPKDRVNVINYFCNGLQSSASPTISFMDNSTLINNPSLLVSTINSINTDLIIVDFNIDECDSIESIKNTLKIFDNDLKALYDNMNGSKYTLIVTSLYGISKAYLNERGNLCQVIFSDRVPFLFIDDFITRREYLITNGNINGIFKSVYKNLNNKSEYESLVERQNALYRLFFKG